MTDASSGELRVLVVAPTRRDAEVTCDLLAREDIACVICKGLPDLTLELDADVGAVLVTDAVLNDRNVAEFLASLRQQPSWSDIPTIVLTRDRAEAPSAVLSLTTLSNVTILDRPSSTRSVVSAVKSALRARRRQYEIRDQLVAQQKAETALLDADKRKDEFLATLAHELRNPLAAIRTGLEVLVRSRADGDRTDRMLAMIDRQSRLLVKIIDDLMDVSRISTGKVVLDRERLDLRAVLETGLEGGRTVEGGPRHDLVMKLPSAPVWINGDSARLIQVFGNLINNAIKYTPQGGRIAISLTREGEDAVVRIVDEGVGIPAEMLHEVFEMFAQVDRNLDRSSGGLGIGLSLVRRLVDLHGGVVSAESGGVGQGSTFTVRLPALAADGSDRGEAPAAASQASRRALKVLVVDDNRDVADALAALLEEGGHEIRIAYDGPAGLRTAAELAPDVVFCDVGMPGMNGREVARRLRSAPDVRSPLLVAVTGWGTEEDKRLCEEAGFDFHCTKPVSAEQLESVLALVPS
jgi:two-component system, sensor histidine kinase